MKTPIEHVEHRRIGAAHWQAQQTLGVAIERFLRAEGLGLSRSLALMALRDEPGLSGAALARRLLITAQSAGTLLTQLDGQGWMDRKPHAVHCAVLERFLFPAGHTKLKRMNDIFDDFDARLGMQLSAEERSQLSHSLRICLNAAVDMLRDGD